MRKRAWRDSTVRQNTSLPVYGLLFIGQKLGKGVVLWRNKGEKEIFLIPRRNGGWLTIPEVGDKKSFWGWQSRIQRMETKDLGSRNWTDHKFGEIGLSFQKISYDRWGLRWGNSEKLGSEMGGVWQYLEPQLFFCKPESNLQRDLEIKSLLSVLHIARVSNIQLVGQNQLAQGS